MRVRNRLRTWKALALLWVTDHSTYQLIQKTRNSHLTYLDAGGLKDLYDAVKELERQQVIGLMIEAGCALGGSALILGKTKMSKRELILYDVFGMIPPPSEKDGVDVHQRYQQIASGQSPGIGGGIYYGYQTNLLKQVMQTFRDYGLPPEENQIRFVQGLYQDTLQVQAPVALAHIDCDWYESVMICLQRIEPHLVKGGKLIIDDYYHWSGCKRAVHDYFAGREQDYQWVRKTSLHLTRHQ